MKAGKTSLPIGERAPDPEGSQTCNYKNEQEVKSATSGCCLD
jgi:hypothetical protein